MIDSYRRHCLLSLPADLLERSPGGVILTVRCNPGMNVGRQSSQCYSIVAVMTIHTIVADMAVHGVGAHGTIHRVGAGLAVRRVVGACA